MEIFPKVSPEIIHIAKKELDDLGIKRDTREAVKAQFGKGGGARLEEGRSDSVSSTSHSTMPSVTPSFFVPRTTPIAQPSIRSIVKIKEKWDMLYLNVVGVFLNKSEVRMLHMRE